MCPVQLARTLIFAYCGDIEGELSQIAAPLPEQSALQALQLSMQQLAIRTLSPIISGQDNYPG
jgi:hypothetical protein